MLSQFFFFFQLLYLVKKNLSCSQFQILTSCFLKLEIYVILAPCPVLILLFLRRHTKYGYLPLLLLVKNPAIIAASQKPIISYCQRQTIIFACQKPTNIATYQQVKTPINATAVDKILLSSVTS